VRWARGELEFVGRADGQVKIRGFRIEPGEIEAVVATCPQVVQAAVAVWENQPGGANLVAYVVPARNHDPAGLPSAIRDWVSARLPGHMVPSAVVPVAAFPLTVSGKLDRNALPALRSTESSSGLDETDTERRIAAIWAHLLGRAGVTRLDHFIELGGHSLMAARVAAWVRAELHTEVQVRDVYDYPLLADFATRVEALRTRQPVGTSEGE
jgi:hypothetical protein